MIAGAISAISAIAPYIASQIGGFFHGDAKEAIQKATGIDISGPVDVVMSQLDALTPEQRLLMTQEDNAYKLKRMQISSRDLKNAQDTTVALSNTKWGWIALLSQSMGAAIVMCIFIMLNLYAMHSGIIDAQDRSQIITSDIAIVMLLVGYWWGKSKTE